MIEIPPLPPPLAGEDTVGHADVLPRYEDIAQDGRLLLTPMMTGLGQSIWRELMRGRPWLAELRRARILPILRRLVMVGEGGPVSVNEPVHYEGCFRFAREKGGDRLFLNMWLTASAPRASTLDDTKAGGERYRVGQVFAEHVITRPFAPPEERKVTRLDAPGVPPIPEGEHVFLTAESLADAGQKAQYQTTLDSYKKGELAKAEGE